MSPGAPVTTSVGYNGLVYTDLSAEMDAESITTLLFRDEMGG